MKGQQVNLFGRNSYVQIVGRPGEEDAWTWRVFTKSESERDTPDGLTFRTSGAEQASELFESRLRLNLDYYASAWASDFLLTEKEYQPRGEEIYSFLVDALRSIALGEYSRKLIIERPIRGGVTSTQVMVRDSSICFETKSGRKETRRFDLRAFFLDPDLFRQKYPSGYFNMHVPKSFRN